MKSPYPSTQDPTYHEALRESAGRVLADGTGPALQLFNPETVRALAATPVGAAESGRRGLELFLNVNSWLAGQGVRVAL